MGSPYEAIDEVYGPLSCHPMDSGYKSIEIEDSIGVRPVAKLLWRRGSEAHRRVAVHSRKRVPAQ